ncbi:uncharacterized protein LOC128715247 [Anopheles marshallii]|uniref:uncharacterized protein LOC128715247 n=1 Tax=Anopheles marshallii TaxID=1521116 RepID=UPI00237A605C|nr:uncharacterized protein LOC128715247 [Anopheles marshallii]
MKMVSVALVLILFGTACSSYAIDCMDVWDDESITEMVEDDRRYEESLKAGHDQYEDDENDEHPVDNEDGILAGSHEEDEAGDGDGHGHYDESNVKHSEQTQRHKRGAPLAEQVIVGEAMNEESTDLETAETHLFRPVFRYKSQYTERRRVRTSNGGDNLAPIQ